MSDPRVLEVGNQPVYRNSNFFDVDVPTMNGGGRIVKTGYFVVGDYFTEFVRQSKMLTGMPPGFCPPLDRVVTFMTLGAAASVHARILEGRPTENTIIHNPPVRVDQAQHVPPEVIGPPSVENPNIPPPTVPFSVPPPPPVLSALDPSPEALEHTAEQIRAANLSESARILQERQEALARPLMVPEPPMPAHVADDADKKPLLEALMAPLVLDNVVNLPEKRLLDKLPDQQLRKISAHFGVPTNLSRKDMLKALNKVYPDNP